MSFKDFYVKEDISDYSTLKSDLQGIADKITELQKKLMGEKDPQRRQTLQKQIMDLRNRQRDQSTKSNKPGENGGKDPQRERQIQTLGLTHISYGNYKDRSGHVYSWDDKSHKFVPSQGSGTNQQPGNTNPESQKKPEKIVKPEFPNDIESTEISKMKPSERLRLFHYYRDLLTYYKKKNLEGHGEFDTKIQGLEDKINKLDKLSTTPQTTKPGEDKEPEAPMVPKVPLSKMKPEHKDQIMTYYYQLKKYYQNKFEGAKGDFKKSIIYVDRLKRIGDEIAKLQKVGAQENPEIEPKKNPEIKQPERKVVPQKTTEPEKKIEEPKKVQEPKKKPESKKVSLAAQKGLKHTAGGIYVDKKGNRFKHNKEKTELIPIKKKTFKEHYYEENL